MTSFLSFVSCDSDADGVDNNGESYAEIQDTVTVSIANGTGYKVTSKNPLNVMRGNDAEFSITIESGYEFESATADAEYIDGKILIKNLQYPTTVEIILKKASSSTDIIIPPGTDDTPDEPTDDTPTTDEPTVELITTELSASPKDGFKFICWSIDLPITEGGKVLSTKNSGSFEIPKDSTAVANYVENEFDVILYRTNGGKVAENGADFYYQTVSNKYYYLPNTLHQNGTFERAGHVLLRYTENPDGSGKYTTLGGNIEPVANGFCELYLLWAPVSTEGFSISVEEGDDGEFFAVIDKYSGNAKSVIIPEYVIADINGENKTVKVEKISAGAFKGADITSLTLPVTIREVEDGAFEGCKSLK